MMQCPKCGYTNQDGSLFCNGCGTPLASTPSAGTPQESKPKRRGLMIAILCIVLVAAIGIGAAVWIMNSQPEDRLMKAVKKTDKAISSLYAQNNNMAALGENLKNLKDSNALTMLMEINDGHDMMKFQIHGQGDAGLCKMTYNIMGISMNMNIYFDQEQMQLSIPEYMDEVLGMPTENLEENLKKSWIGQNMDIEVLSGFNQFSNIASPYEKEIQAILDSLVVDKPSTVELTLGETTRKCDAYQVNWDANAVLDFYKAAYLNNPAVSSASSALPYDDSQFEEIMQQLDDLETTMYVDDRGYWIGMDIMNEDDGFEIRYIGTDNICQTTAISVISDGQKETIHFISNVTADDVEIIMQQPITGEQLTFLRYAKDGALSIMPDEVGAPMFRLTPADDGVELTFTEDFGTGHFTMALYPLKEKVAPLADTYRNMLEMDENDFKELILSISGS